MLQSKEQTEKKKRTMNRPEKYDTIMCTNICIMIVQELKESE